MKSGVAWTVWAAAGAAVVGGGAATSRTEVTNAWAAAAPVEVETGGV
jgi:hypothetical protein